MSTRSNSHRSQRFPAMGKIDGIKNSKPVVLDTRSAARWYIPSCNIFY